MMFVNSVTDYIRLIISFVSNIPGYKFGPIWIFVELLMLLTITPLMLLKPFKGVYWRFTSFINKFINFCIHTSLRLYGSIIFIGASILILFETIQESQPWIFDEEANLLIADNFLQGRFSQPTHQEYEFFETIYVLNKPTYTGQFPPSQGMFIA